MAQKIRLDVNVPVHRRGVITSNMVDKVEDALQDIDLTDCFPKNNPNDHFPEYSTTNTVRVVETVVMF